MRVFAAPGNDDFFEVDELLAASNTIELLEMKVYRLTDEHEIITSGWTNPTPWNTERECSEEELATRLQTMFEKVEDMEHCIFNIHVPPYDSKIYICPKLDQGMRVVYDMGNPGLRRRREARRSGRRSSGCSRCWDSTVTSTRDEERRRSAERCV